MSATMISTLANTRAPLSAVKRQRVNTTAAVATRPAKALTGAVPRSFMGMKSAKGFPAALASEKSVDDLFVVATSRARVSSKKQTRASVADEIFKVSPVIAGCVLVGLALGFVLLRFESFVENEE